MLSPIRRCLAVAAAAAAVSLAAPAAAAPTWIQGTTARSTVWNCTSLIFGSPYPETGMTVSAWVYMDPAAPPKVGDVFELATTAYAIGNPCTDPVTQQAAFQWQLPVGLQPAYDRVPIDCIRYDLAANTSSRFNGCPTATRPGLDGLMLPYGGATPQPAGFALPTAGWVPIAQGIGAEIQLPVRATRPLRSEQVPTVVRLYDANDNPLLTASVPVTVDPAPTPTPSPAPSPAPGPDPSPGPSPPAPPGIGGTVIGTLRVIAPSHAAVASGHRTLTVRLGTHTPGRVTLRLTGRGRTAGRLTRDLAAGLTKARLRVARSARPGRYRLHASWRPDQGPAASGTIPLRLSRRHLRTPA